VTGDDSGTFETMYQQLAQGHWQSLKTNSKNPVSHGKGRIFFVGGLPGKDYVYGLYRERNPRLPPVLEQANITPWINGKAEVYIQAFQLKKKMICHLVNFGWVSRDDKKAAPVTVTLSLPWPRGQEIKHMTVASPEQPEGRTVPFKRVGDTIQCEVEVLINSLVIIEQK
jgi:hypothetical protein